MFETIYMMLSFIDDVKKEVEDKNGFIDKFRFEFNTMWKTEKFQAPTLLPPEKEGETMTEYLTTQKKYNHDNIIQR